MFESLMMIGLYILPTIVAVARKHRSHNAIGMMNLLLGWTVIFWVFALIWAFTGNVREKTV